MNSMSSVITNTETIEDYQRDQQNYKQYKPEIIWRQVFYLVFFHSAALYGAYLCFISTNWKTILFAFVYSRIILSSSSAGVHRLWAHRSYKAELPLRIFLCIMAWALGENNIYHWCRDHRIHHKYADSDADPSNIRRGFFFSHMGWLIYKKHPAFYEAFKKLPMDDLLADPVVRFNRDYHFPMWMLFCFIAPAAIPVYLWNEKWLDAFCVAGALKYIVTLHGSFFINSVAHTFGYRPFDKRIQATESHFTEYFFPGEGSHNYHHAFPRDYRTKEYVLSLNSGRLIIEFMAFIGQAYDLKMSSDEVTTARRLKTGDCS